MVTLRYSAGMKDIKEGSEIKIIFQNGNFERFYLTISCPTVRLVKYE